METFVVRAWRSGGEASTGDEVLRGIVEHVASGRTMPFHNVEQLVTFLRSLDGGDAAGT